MKITREVWDRKHSDFKGERKDGQRSVLMLDRKTGATVLQPVEVVDVVTPEECEHTETRHMLKGDWRVVECLNCLASRVTGVEWWRDHEEAERAFLATYPPASARDA